MTAVIPSDTHAPGDTGHTTDHNDIADVLSLLVQVLAQADLSFTTVNATAIGDLQELQSSNYELVPVSAQYPVGGSTGRGAVTLVADPYLTVPLQASAIYEIDTVIQYNGGAGASAGYLQWDYSVPAGSNFIYAAHFLLSTTGLPMIRAKDGSDSTDWANTTGVSNQLAMTHHGTIYTSTTPGNLVWNWGLNVANGTNTHITQGTRLTATRVG